MNTARVGPTAVSDLDLPAMAELWGLFDAHLPELEAASMVELVKMPLLVEVLAKTDPELLQAQSEASRKLQRGALVEGKWGPYLEDLRQQGAIYAQMGMKFSDWYRILGPTRKLLVPVILARPDGDRILRALSTFVEIVMAELGDAYVVAMQAQVLRTEEERNQYIAELERSNKELDAFAYVASHDLKAPLRDIDNLSGWILEDARPLLPVESQRHLDRLRDRIVRMEGLLDDLLAYSRAGRKIEASETFAVADAVAAALSLVGPRGDIRVEVTGAWPSVQTPRAPLELIVRNLVSNALKHHDRDDGRVTVGGGVVGRQIELWVEDDGPGIPEPFQERVFLMFQTLRPRDQVEGSGMGLAIVKKVVGSFGGKIQLRSEGRGARFTFTWPLRWPPEARR